MPSIVHTPKTTLDCNPDVTSPDWNVVPFEVGCARCGQDLRGLAEPKCPACGFEFDWSKAVPIEHLVCRHCAYHLCGLRENRCPECGEPFTWKEVLDDYHRRRKPLFEYRWRDRPLRSLLYTWWLALRPWKLWRTIDIHDPPQARPLLITVAAVFIAFLVCLGSLDGVASWAWSNYYRWGPAWPSIVGRGPPGPDFSEIPGYILKAFSNPVLQEITVAAGVWIIVSFAALLLFQQSMRRGRIRTIHVLRAWAYALPPMLPVIAVGFCGYRCAATVVYVRYYSGASVSLGIFFLLAHVVWSLHHAYKKYLRMPHSLGVAVASQIIAVLVTFTVPVVRVFVASMSL